MAYEIAAIPMTLSDLRKSLLLFETFLSPIYLRQCSMYHLRYIYLPTASLSKCYFVVDDVEL